jgi:chromosome segregation ATPase
LAGKTGRSDPIWRSSTQEAAAGAAQLDAARGEAADLREALGASERAAAAAAEREAAFRQALSKLEAKCGQLQLELREAAAAADALRAELEQSEVSELCLYVCPAVHSIPPTPTTNHTTTENE